MINPSSLLCLLHAHGVRFITGVPDSLLKPFITEIDNCGPHLFKHMPAFSEGAAIALAAGHHLATGHLPVVYMQNSGLGNAINPLVSVCSSEVHGIPMLLVIGWRGEIPEIGGQVHDEPQHSLQGLITLQQLELLHIPMEVLSSDSQENIILPPLLEIARRESRPVALVVRSNVLKSDGEARPEQNPFGLLELTRDAAICACAEHLPPNIPIICTTGMASRELHEFRMRQGLEAGSDFLVVGGMGLASMIALGVLQAEKVPKVMCIDGDGAASMHLGGIPYTSRHPGIIHVLINNGCHDSVGGFSTVGQWLNFSDLAKACGFTNTARVQSMFELRNAVSAAITSDTASFIEILCRPGNRVGIGRPGSPQQAKVAFANFLRNIH
ncbi:Phosphonopyruvate decarboxylase [Acidithiobacillus ferrivorans]|uniref:Phosphonopyruvate decarboxylase n=1 Tax=Acidithiobacillus ferrivorans TaxID=160808 RepID=A0A060UQD3_9PROT|nr:phosphonopyruvate decarboxylase [Acidithiobacillus ferrivorans]CDQ10471.1 Phosphonopyruvate decarboxylase [Acidithiobacillus ferrivorans]SMH64499.1 Phosphonopyruvate decarboxylase [Acidithiobacillus ferrivorans]